MDYRRVIGIGETVLDILFKNDQPQKAVPGGSAFNSIVSLGRAGVPCAMVTEVGGDHIGDMICRYLRKNGVSDDFVHRHSGTKSHITPMPLRLWMASYHISKPPILCSLARSLPSILLSVPPFARCCKKRTKWARGCTTTSISVRRTSPIFLM